jgi:hypothetical protein
MELLQRLVVVTDTSPVTQALARYSRPPKRYPFGNPMSIERKDVPLVKRVGVWVAEKTDGVRVCLLLTTTSENVTAAYLMDRNCTVYGCPLGASKSMFKDSLFDCEIVGAPAGNAGSDAWTLVVFDVAVLKGDPGIGHQPLSARLKALETVIGTQVSVRIPGVMAVPKPMYYMALPDKASGLPSDGYILTAEGAPVSRPGSARDVWKIKAHHTIDLLVGPEKTLWCGDSGDLVALASLRYPDLPSLPHCLQAGDPRVAEGTIVELEPRGTASAMVLAFVRVRSDRTTPNNLGCVVSTLKSVVDNVRVEDIL